MTAVPEPSDATRARMKLGDLLMDPDTTEAQVNAAQQELLQAIRGERILPTLIKNREQRLCTWVRDTDGEHCALPDAGVHWPHMTYEGVQFPPAARGFEGRELRVT